MLHPMKDPIEPVDVLIIGGGPSGLSAATTLYRHQHDIRIFDHGRPRNSWDTSIRAFPGWAGAKPSTFVAKTKAELESTGFVTFISSEVLKFTKSDDGLFHLTTSDGVEWAGRKLLLAMGVDIMFPDIPGYAENYPDRM
jgi:thioredoxin reductase